MTKNLFYLIGGTLLGVFLSALSLAALALVADAVWASDREDQSTLKDRS